MQSPLQVCKASPADTGIISRIIERSIRVGCALDHRNDPHTLAIWTRDKTLEHIQPWLADPRLYLNIALLQDKPVGVAMATLSGRLALCYVLPEWFRRGAGRALVHDAESWLIEQGRVEVHLNSTRTGEPFYCHLGYQPCAQAFTTAGLHAIPMQKALARSAEKPDQGAKSSVR